MVSSLVVGIVLDGGGEERVDEGRLAEARLAGDLVVVGKHDVAVAVVRLCAYHYGEGSTALGDNLVPVLR